MNFETGKHQKVFIFSFVIQTKFRTKRNGNNSVCNNMPEDVFNARNLHEKKTRIYGTVFDVL